ncbi:carboxypeptidase-like regulatory domain-containing protein [Flavobacterium sp.]|uniref:carboxypeptidase-like regulatory domain-containing protein n=1 Tax=Flavobacterium sp. TaxID=239 RepID=UPI002636C433|nr:carboxypeptidase-like regulatory domain-containing protein [Flavobacterium sp.]
MKNLLQFALFLCSSFLFAQNVRVEGTVTELGKTPLEMANVMAVNQETKAVDSYAITNDKGRYSLNLKTNATYTIKLSYIGMQNKEITLQTKIENITQNIAMEPGGIQLDGVEIIKEMPVSIKGDTIMYNADSFKNGTERKLEDILKKLPGVEVNADGEVEVEGKKVTKLMVEGKDFFDGDTKLGVKNIPADAIDKVQVLRNYNENSILKGVENNQDNIAMNIKLKEGKKNFWFGDVTSAGGFQPESKFDRYNVNPKLFYYNPKYSVNVITNINNIGELPLTIQDYFKITGGFRNMMSKGGSSFNVSSNDLGLSLLRNNRAKNIDTQFGAVNFSYNPSKSWTLSGFGIYSGSKTELETQTVTTNFANNTIANTVDRTSQSNRFGLMKGSASYKPSTTLQLDYDILVKKSDQLENGNLFRNIIAGSTVLDETILTNKDQEPISVNQNLALYHAPSEKHVIAFEAQHLYQNEDPFYNANLALQPFLLNGYITQNRNDYNQNRLIKTHKVDAKLDYYYMVTPKANLNLTLGNTYSKQRFNSSIFQILDNGVQNNLTAPENNNDVSYDFNDVFLGVHYKMLYKKFTFNPGVSLHYYDLNNVQLGSSFKQSFMRVLPDFYALYQIKKSETLTYNFALTNDFADVTRLAEGSIINNYASLSSGNRRLENAIAQTHSLRYFKYNMFNFENINAAITYTRRMDAIKSQTSFVGVNQISTPFNNINFVDETLSGFGQYGRSFLKYYKASLSTNVSWSKFYNFLNGESALSRSVNQNHTVRLSTNFKNIPNLELGYTYSISEFENPRSITKFFTDKPFARIEYYFLEGFSFVSEYEFYHYYNSDKSVDNEYDFLSASFGYQKKGSKWEYRISGTNLLNTKALNDNSFDQFRITDSQFFVQPRYVMLTLRYNL